VKVRVVAVDMEKNQMKLSMRQGGGGGAPRERADLTSFQDIPSDLWLDGKVVSIQHFGAFVSVSNEEGKSAQGLVHVSQIKDDHVESVEDELSVGQEVRVWVEGVDLESGKMSLSMRE